MRTLQSAEPVFLKVFVTGVRNGIRKGGRNGERYDTLKLQIISCGHSGCAPTLQCYTKYI